MVLDGKCHGTLISNHTGKEIPADEFLVFRVHDAVLVSMLKFYQGECVKHLADAIQLKAMDAIITKVEAWQRAHPERMKVADVAPGELPAEFFEQV